MFLRVAVLAFLLLTRIRFPRKKSSSCLVRKRYIGEVLKAIRQFEKVKYKLRKAKLCLRFLVNCQNKNIVRNFLKFYLANKILQNSVTYREYQQRLLLTEINNDKIHLRTLQNELSRLHSDLQQTFFLIVAF